MKTVAIILAIASSCLAQSQSPRSGPRLPAEPCAINEQFNLVNSDSSKTSYLCKSGHWSAISGPSQIPPVYAWPFANWADDGKTISAPAGRNVAIGATVLPAGVPVTVTAYSTGAHPVDPTGSVDSTAGIQAAIDAVKTTTNGTLYFPAGTYATSGVCLDLSHIQNKGMTIQGAGQKASIIQVTGCAIGVDVGGSNRITMRDIGIVSVGAGVGLAVTRYTDSSYNGESLFENIAVSGTFTKAAVASISSEGNTWKHNYISSSTGGIPVFYLSLNDGLTIGSPRGTIQALSNVNTNLIGNLIYDTVDNASTISLQINGDSAGVNLNGNYILSRGKGIYRTGTSGATYGGPVNIEGNGIEVPGDGTTAAGYCPVCFSDANFANVTIRGNSFIHNSGTTASVQQSANGSLITSAIEANQAPGNSPAYSFYTLTNVRIFQPASNIAVANTVAGSNIYGNMVTVTGATANSDIQTQTTRAINAPTTLSNLITGSFKPATDSTTAVQLFKADGSTTVWCADTTNGRFGIGLCPTHPFQMSAADGAVNALFQGTTKAIRFGFNSTESRIEGVDNTGSGSFQPLVLGGSVIKIDTGGSATKIVCYKSDGKTLGYATMAAGDISACN